MAIAREAEPVSSLHEIREAGLDREDLLGMTSPTGSAPCGMLRPVRIEHWTIVLDGREH